MRANLRCPALEVVLFTKTTPFIVATFVAFGCAESATAPTPDSDPIQAAVGRVEHRVTVGGPDACAGFGLTPGCDANFSLVAVQGANGVEGQWHDQFAGGVGVHADVQCLYVVGNEAWVGGVITQSRIAAFVGLPVATRVADNGRSANDPPDQISFSVIGADICTQPATPGFPLFDAPQGQTVVVD